MVTITSLVILVILASLCLLSQSKAMASNEITTGQPIGVSETIESPNGVFELGFFRPQKDKYYVGIWYKNISENSNHHKTVSEFNCVWVANRDYPALTSSATLTLRSDGNIVILDGKMSYTVTNMTSPTSNNVSEEKRLQATVLNSGNFVLITRDHSDRDYYLWQSFDHPTNTLLPGTNISSSSSSSLVSWKSHDDPSPGKFSVRLDSVVKRQIVIEKGHETYELLDEGHSHGLINGIVTNQSGLSETISRLVLTQSGKLERESWSPTKHCWDSDSKCQEKQHNKSHGFRDLYVLIITIGIVAILLFAAFVFTRIRSLQAKGENLVLFDVEMSLKHSNQELPDLNQKHKKGSKKSIKLSFFSFSSVGKATDSFSDVNKIGQGGFGPVYKGTLLKGDEVAVKRLSTKSRQGKEQFKNEVHLIARLQHKNLVRLLGCCIEKREQILIYEYMPNKSLDFFLYESARRRHLKWPTRVKIIEGIAQGLLYLHKYSRIKIVHRDLKPGNILLDIEMNPRISDFGMARIFSSDQFNEMTATPAGTYGYMAPEAGQRGIFSEKSDVYSFGVLFLEILSGKKHTIVHDEETRGLVAYAWKLWISDRAMDFLDPLIEDPVAMRKIIRYIHIALLCLQEVPADRPNMSLVATMLNNSDEVLPYPNQPGFLNSTSFAMSRPRANNAVETRPEVFSVNDATLSDLEPR